MTTKTLASVRQRRRAAELRVGERIETTNGFREVLAVAPQPYKRVKVSVQCPVSPGGTVVFEVPAWHGFVCEGAPFLQLTRAQRNALRTLHRVGGRGALLHEPAAYHSEEGHVSLVAVRKLVALGLAYRLYEHGTHWSAAITPAGVEAYHALPAEEDD